MNNIKEVAIIGGGPSGIAAARALMAENYFTKIVIFEQRNQLGGIWNLTKPDHPHGNSPTNGVGGIPQPSSPIYESLETNLPKTIMEFVDLPFPDSSPMFPNRATVLEYIQRVAQELKVPPLSHLNCRVENCERVEKNGAHKWEIYVSEVSSAVSGSGSPSSRLERYYFDAVIVATGHYDKPYIPEVPGLIVWRKRFPGTVTHSKDFSTARQYSDKRVLIVGNGSSGLDLSVQIAKAGGEVWRSFERPNESTEPSSAVGDESSVEMLIEQWGQIHDKPLIQRYDAMFGTVHFQDGSVLANVDHIIYCTGYLYYFPFLDQFNQCQSTSSSSYTSCSSNSTDCVVTTGKRINRLFQQIFYIPDPTLTFLAMNKFIVPFPMAESQAALVARVYSGRGHLPSEPQMRARERQEEQLRGDQAGFHNYKFPADVEYMRLLASEVEEIDQRSGKIGFRARVWGEDLYKLREGASKAKARHWKEIMEREI